jgi:hypothetical protein
MPHGSDYPITVKVKSFAHSCSVIVLTRIPVFISGGLKHVSLSWGDNAAERVGDKAQIERLFGVVLASQPTPALHIHIQNFSVEIEGRAGRRSGR